MKRLEDELTRLGLGEEPVYGTQADTGVEVPGTHQ
jgi:hypothetical protein